MATLTVTTAADVVDPRDGVLSLREAVQQANATAAADMIRFATAIEGRTLVLTGGQLTVSGDVTIDGDADESGDRVTIDAAGNGRVLLIGGTGTDARLEDLGITGGDTAVSEDGAGILVGAGNTLALDQSRVTGNSTLSGASAKSG
jgi:hypothetical protein